MEKVTDPVIVSMQAPELPPPEASPVPLPSTGAVPSPLSPVTEKGASQL